MLALPSKCKFTQKKKIFQVLLPHDKMVEQHDYSTKFEHSLDTIRQQMQKYHKLSTQDKPTSKKTGCGNPSVVVELIIRETESLLQILYSKFEEDEKATSSYLYSVVSTETQREIALYSIQSAICIYQLNNIKKIYYQNAKAQCQRFNNHCESINSSLSNTDFVKNIDSPKKISLTIPQSKLKQIQHCTSMREMLLIIQKTFSSLKLDCLMAHHGKVELSSMDQLWPVLIFVTTRAAVPNFPVYINLLNDYVRLKGVFQLEETVIMSFDIAVQDVVKKETVNKL